MVDISISLLNKLRQPANQQAWQRFVQLYTPLLMHWANRLGLQENDSADLIQDVFLVLLTKLSTFQYDPDKSFRAWLWTIVRNKHHDRCRRRAAEICKLHEWEAVSHHRESEPDCLDEEEYRDYLLKRALQLMQTEFSPGVMKPFP